MIRKDKQISDSKEMASIIRRAAYCHLALADEGRSSGRG